MIAKKAHKNGTSLKEEALKSGLINAEEYRRLINPMKMTRPD
jgi:fumarate hydratase class II